jgi:hypothetical protein
MHMHYFYKISLNKKYQSFDFTYLHKYIYALNKIESVFEN